MKKSYFLVFPLFFALLTLALFLILYRPGPGTPETASACLVFLTALGWSALIVFGRREMHGLKVFYAAAALLASVLSIRIFPLFPVDRLQHGLMIAMQALGMVGIVLYLRILRRNKENDNE